MTQITKIKYYVALNQEGKRAIARREEIALSEFVGLLSEAATDEGNEPVAQVLESQGGDYVQNLQHGLLTAKPRLWSGA